MWCYHFQNQTHFLILFFNWFAQGRILKLHSFDFWECIHLFLLLFYVRFIVLSCPELFKMGNQSINYWIYQNGWFQDAKIIQTMFQLNTTCKCFLLMNEIFSSKCYNILKLFPFLMHATIWTTNNRQDINIMPNKLRGLEGWTNYMKARPEFFLYLRRHFCTILKLVYLWDIITGWIGIYGIWKEEPMFIIMSIMTNFRGLIDSIILELYKCWIPCHD